MLKDITTITVLGANFDSSTSFDFFKPHGDKVKTIKGALLYGRNGTGKSTIAKAFRKLAGENVPVITAAEFIDDANQQVILDEEEKKRIFIFDEHYVDKNVRLQEDHLETIVMLGQAADLTEKIEQTEKERDKAKKDYEQQEAEYKKYCDEKNPCSPEYHLKRLEEALQGDDNWAGRDRQIRDKKHNTPVKKDTYKEFVELKPSKPKTELIADFKAKQKELQEAKTGASTIETRVPLLPESYNTYDSVAVQQLLAEKIEEPELSEREKKLLALLREGKGEELSERKTVFEKKETLECPYCFQSVTSAHKASLVESIERVLSKAVEEHQRALRGHIVDLLEINLSSYVKLGGYQTCIDLLTDINREIQKNNENLKRKVANPYEPITSEIPSVESLATQLSSALENLEKARAEHNRVAKKTSPIIADLNRINGEIAHYDVKDLAKQLNKQKEKHKEFIIQYKKIKEEYDAKEKAVEELNAQRRNVKLAIDKINDCLKYIFFANDRLKIEHVDGKYKLLSYGKNVSPCNVSAGERNIIGLSYFFTSILEGQEENDAYEKEYMLVIDDPVSSFDVENRIGILSFLKYKLSVFLEGNRDTKALVMTHDLMAFYDLRKVFDEIVTACKQVGKQSGAKINLFEIRERRLIDSSVDKRHEYTEILKNIYEYANNQTNNFEFTIGNMMRQILEAFSTFLYKKGIKDISRNQQILDLLGCPKYISYYKNLMYRLVLNGGSHMEERVKAMKDLSFFNLISEEEKKRTAKDILCFIYLLNERHLLEHLRECENVEIELKNWCKNILERAANI